MNWLVQHVQHDPQMQVQMFTYMVNNSCKEDSVNTLIFNNHNCFGFGFLIWVHHSSLMKTFV